MARLDHSVSTDLAGGTLPAIDVAVRSIFEVHLAVKDCAAATRFYTKVLGFSVARTSHERDFSFLWMGKPGEMIARFVGRGFLESSDIKRDVAFCHGHYIE